jgi:hypothetical protein
MTTYKILKFEGKEYAILWNNSTTIILGTNSQEEQAYLKWIEAGNTPLPAEENT